MQVACSAPLRMRRATIAHSPAPCDQAKLNSTCLSLQLSRPSPEMWARPG